MRTPIGGLPGRHLAELAAEHAPGRLRRRRVGIGRRREIHLDTRCGPLTTAPTSPDGAPAHDLPPQPAVFAPDYAPEEIAEIAQKLRKQAGLPDEPLGNVSEESTGLLGALTSKVRS